MRARWRATRRRSTAPDRPSGGPPSARPSVARPVVQPVTREVARREDDRDADQEQDEDLVERQAIDVRLELLDGCPPEESFADEQAGNEEGGAGERTDPPQRTVEEQHLGEDAEHD